MQFTREGLPVMAVFPAATAGMGYLMANEMRKVEAEKALLQSEENFRRSLDESPFGMYIVSNEGKTLYANPAFLDLFGYDTIGRFEGSPSESRYTPESYRAHEERKEKRRKGEYVEPEYDIEIIRTDGERRCVHVPDEAREIIFDSFRAAAVSPTKVVRGAGVGLPVAKQLTGLLGGELVLQSAPGKGTVVRFYLPLQGV